LTSTATGERLEAMATSGTDTADPLRGVRLAFFGRLASMSRRDATQLLRSRGAVVVEKPDETLQLAVVGEHQWPLPQGGTLEDWLDEPMRQAVERGTLEVVSETQLWQRLGLVEPQPDVHRLYTPAMLAQLLRVPVEVIRRWHRRGLIVPVREVRRLPYFDFQEVATARRLAELLAAGASPRVIERKLAALARYLPGVGRPMTQLSVIVHGKEILLRQGNGLIEPGGQLRFDFDVWDTGTADHVGEAFGESGEQAVGGAPQPVPEAASSEFDELDLPLGCQESPAADFDDDRPAVLPGPFHMGDDLCRLAAELEEDGQLAAAAEMYRAALAAGGLSAEICFQLAELLYRMGDLAAARERYYVAVELDEDYVEARANLGCVLAETGQRDLAVAAFEGALRYHADYADVHFHLAETLHELARDAEAADHWRAFLQLAPDSPWAEQAQARLAVLERP
jgi:tetratricopeptide (TPR) repeat protein